MTATVALAIAMLAVELDGSSSCPTPEAVAERLRPLLPPDASGVGRVTLEPGPEGLRLSLMRSDGSRGGVRTLAGDHTCDELADAAAVIIASWQDDGGGRDRLPAAPAIRAASE